MGIFGDKIVEKVKNEVKGRKIMLIIDPLVSLITCLFLLACESKITFVAYLAAAIFVIYWAIVPGGVVGYTGSIYGRKTLGKIWGLATCSRHSIKQEDLKVSVLEMIRHYINSLGKYESISEKVRDMEVSYELFKKIDKR